MRQSAYLVIGYNSILYDIRCILCDRLLLRYDVVLEFYVPPTAKVIWRWNLGFKVSFERLKKPGIELTTPGL